MKVNKLTLIVAAGLILRFILWIFQDWSCGDDGMRYLQESVNVVNYGIFSTDMTNGSIPMPDAHDLPLWPLLMAMILYFTKSIVITQYVSGFINILFMAGAVYFLCRLLREKPFGLGDNGLAVACALLLFMPETIPYSLFHMPDMMAVFFLTLGLWAFYSVCTKSINYIWLFAGSFGCAILAKPICIPIFLAFAVASIFVLRASIACRLGACAGALCVVGLMLTPWIVRNDRAFGTPGLTTISGTNLYSCNLGWCVASLPSKKKAQLESEMQEFEKTLEGLDKMESSKRKGAFAKEKILEILPEYAVYTIKNHPRLYAGTATVALLRYAGLKKLCYALEDKMTGGSADPDPSHRVEYGKSHVYVALALQGFAWLSLLVCYGCVGLGIVVAVKRLLDSREDWNSRLLVVSPILAILLIAMVIGPVTATRYRFIMIPFFAILSGMVLYPKFVNKAD